MKNNLAGLISSFCLVSMILSMLVSVFAQSGGPFTITKSVIAGGGDRSTGGIFIVDGTIGESVAGTTSSGGIFQLGGGFWGGGAAPAASTASISGRVVTPDGTTGLRNASVFITDGQGFQRSATTSSFGFYSFDNLATGTIYTVRVASRRFRYQQQTVSLSGNLTDINFVGLE